MTSGTFTADGTTISSYRAPLYPALLAASGFLTSDPVWPVLITQIVLGALTVTLTYLIAERAFGQRQAAIAAAILAVSPMTARYTAVLLTETIFTFLVVAGVWTWMERRAAVSGVLFGAAILTRAALLPFVGVVGLCGVALYRRGRHAECWRSLRR